MKESSLNISVIYGSVRTERQGIKAAKFVVKKLEERGHQVDFIDPLEYKLPFVDLMYKEYDPEKAPKVLRDLSKIFNDSDAYVIVSGEYNHGIPPALKNILDHFQSEYHYKPSGIVSYSSGPFGGVRAMVHLRAILGELGTVSIPSTFPISKVQDSFDEDGNAIDKAYERRIERFLDELEWYAYALKTARDKKVPK